MRKADTTKGLSDAGPGRLSPLAETPHASRVPTGGGRRTGPAAPRLPGLLPEPMALAEDAPGHLGHRARMRLRLLTAGPEAVLDHELLEMVLFLALPRRDTKPIARALLARFGSFGNAIAAPLIELRGIAGLGEAGAAALKTVQAAALRLAREEVRQTVLLNSWDRLIDYLTTPWRGSASSMSMSSTSTPATG
jgi:DNA repair protein RadC